MSAIMKIIDSFRRQITLGKENNLLGDRALEEYNQLIKKIDEQHEIIQIQYNELTYIKEALSTLKKFAL
jgi:hypothetical protein